MDMNAHESGRLEWDSESKVLGLHPQSIAERFEGRQPQLDVVRFSALWRPFGLNLTGKYSPLRFLARGPNPDPGA